MLLFASRQRAPSHSTDARFRIARENREAKQTRFLRPFLADLRIGRFSKTGGKGIGSISS
jgi:hypothetical protein